MIRLLHGDCRTVLPTLDACSVDAIVTDPPAGIGFMGKSWDSDKGGRDQWIAWMQTIAAECMRVIKPGGHALVWALPRTSHWTVTAWENAGWEVRDRIAHIFGSGFPKSSRVSRDERFCQCGASGRTSSRTSHETLRDGHIDTAADAGEVASELRSDRHGSQTIQDSPVGCREECDSDDALLRRSSMGAQASTPLRPDVLGHIRSVERVDGQGDAALRTPCQARHSGHPSNQDCLPQFDDLSSQKSGTDSSRKPTLQTGSDSVSQALGTTRMGAILSAWMHCIKCGKPDANGWGTALKPACEDWWLLRKPLAKGCTVAANVQAHSTGALNIDATRVPTFQDDAGSNRRDSTFCTCPSPEDDRTSDSQRNTPQAFSSRGHGRPAFHSASAPGRAPLLSEAQGSLADCRSGHRSGGEHAHPEEATDPKPSPSQDDECTSHDRCAKCGRSRGGRSMSSGDCTTLNVESFGRWPANAIHDGSAEVLAAFPEGSVNKAGVFASGQPAGWPGGSNNIGRSGSATREVFGYGDTGSAARFFYTAKASQHDRNDGLQRVSGNERSGHPTVKPTDLMRWLCRLITPPGGTILDPFCGSGSTLKAAELEGFSAIGIELDQQWIAVARRRIASDAPLFSQVESA